MGQVQTLELMLMQLSAQLLHGNICHVQVYPNSELTLLNSLSVHDPVVGQHYCRNKAQFSGGRIVLI